MSTILVENLEKSFRSVIPEKGSWLQKIKGYLVPRHHHFKAVDKISFIVKPGERVAFIGPNGAGKSTTIKILTGIMVPTAGHVEVLGKIPSVHRRQLAYKVGAIFGQRSQLWYHLPVLETLELLAAIYDIPKIVYKARLKELADKFDIHRILMKPVRQLSLGERMRCELVASLLHKPAVLFLDEPTIGLDITAKTIIRDLIRRQSEEEGATVLLTSHDTDDIEKVCDRVIVIDHGKLLLEDTLSNLKTRYILKKMITVATEKERIEWEYSGTTIVEQSPHHLKIEVDLTLLAVEQVVAALLKNTMIKDLTIEGPPLETIIQALYRNESV